MECIWVSCEFICPKSSIFSLFTILQVVTSVLRLGIQLQEKGWTRSVRSLRSGLFFPKIFNTIWPALVSKLPETDILCVP